jgi:hypothetical protein
MPPAPIIVKLDQNANVSGIRKLSIWLERPVL